VSDDVEMLAAQRLEAWAEARNEAIAAKARILELERLLGRLAGLIEALSAENLELRQRLGDK
jgi:hypothetical protein